MKSSLYNDILNGKYKEKDITIDHLHPNDFGHSLISHKVCDYLNDIFSEASVLVKGKDIKVTKSITDNLYKNAKLYNNTNISPKLYGFNIDYEKKPKYNFFKNGWVGKTKGDKISFEIKSSCLAIQYRKTVKKPSPVAKVYIDGMEYKTLLDSNFNESWGDCLYIEPVFHNLENKKRKIDIEIFEANDLDKNDFYLLSLICD
ncbi:MAG: hypothetical protein ACK5LV_08460 [Lachnospirales bacterium]